ncbi:DUF962 domain-containing protein [bacterium]|nr:DUF962 domain-containing protein [bacterium]MBP9808306.1 DUF962 domain-containing protein [bacterium]
MKNRTGIRRVSKAISRFTVDYMHRHRHPVNAALHIVGVPAAFYGFWLILKSFLGLRSQNSTLSSNLGQNLALGLVCVFFGYLLQYLGHRSQGNEVGEIILIKKVSGRLKSNINGSALWQMLGGSLPSTVGDKRHNKSASSSSSHKRHPNGNGNGHKQPLLTSHSLVWWRKA